MARLASMLPSSSLTKWVFGPALVAHPEVDQALLVVGVIADAVGEEAQVERAEDLLVDQHLVVRNQGEDLQRLQRLGEDLGVAPLVRHLGQVHRPGVPEVQVDEAAGEEVLRPGVVLVGGRSGLDEGVERPRGRLVLLVEVVLQRGVEGAGVELRRRLVVSGSSGLSPALRRSRSAGRRLRRSLTRWRRSRSGGGAGSRGLRRRGRGLHRSRCGRRRSGCRLRRRGRSGRGLGMGREREQKRHRGRGRRLRPDGTHSVPPKLRASANWMRRMFCSRPW